MKTNGLSVSLPDSELRFIKEYARTHGLTVSELIIRYIKKLHKHQPGTIHPDIQNITGILPVNINYRDEYIAHILEKHK
ncbi:MAG: hypothetical protein H8D22_12430 [Candidatus Cloacimonetes bacterium]|nr:hypothetical protein [Candidatus Cloacimonadota bacterium]